MFDQNNSTKQDNPSTSYPNQEGVEKANDSVDTTDNFNVDDIQVIPDKFYGAALKTKLKPNPEQVVNKPQTSSKSKTGYLLIVLVIVVLVALLSVGGYYIYLNKDQFFSQKKSQTEVVQKQEPKPPQKPKITTPKTPENVKASASNANSITISWDDKSDNESAFRIERKTLGDSIYKRISDLPANSTVFQDKSVQASTTYYYRIIARNSAGESPVSKEVVITTPAPKVVKQIKLPPAGLDSDSDGISDLEEDLFKANIHNPDTDGDGFLDGNEVFNLYNPNGRAPAKLVESSTIKKISNEIGWSMYIPTKWKYKLEKDDGTQASIESETGEIFKIIIKDNKNQLSVVDWFMQNNPEVQKEEIMQFTSKKGYHGIISPDLLTTYIPWENKIFAFQYNLMKKPFINYRTVYSMMLNSLELNGLKLEMVPASSGELPFEPEATIPGKITTPKTISSTSTNNNQDEILKKVENVPNNTTTSDIENSANFSGTSTANNINNSNSSNSSTASSTNIFPNQ